MDKLPNSGRELENEDISAPPNSKTIREKTVSASGKGNVLRSIQSTSSSPSPEDPDLNILVADPSVRRSKINKQAYLKLHRSGAKSNRNSVEVLKEKYENTPQTDNSNECKINKGNAGTDNNVVVDKDGKITSQAKNENADYKIIKCEYVDVELRKKNPSTEYVVASISELQNKLSTKLDKDVVESLKTKYSPASFGYPKLSERLQKDSAPNEIQTSSKIPEKPPVPQRRSSVLSESSRQSRERSSTTFQSFNQSPKPNFSRPISAVEKSLTRTRYDNIELSKPESKNIIIRQSSSEDSIEQLENFLSDFTMDKKKSKEFKERKRSSSFRKILSGSFFGKDKKKPGTDKKTELERNGDDEKKNPKKTENAVYSDNFQNEHTFNRNAVQRHTVDYPKPEIKTKPKIDTSQKYFDKSTLDETERRYAEMHINQFNQIKANFSHPENFRKPSVDGYIPMEGPNEKKSMNYINTTNVEKYIDTSSSSNTLDSDNRGTYENALIAQAEMKQLRELEIKRQNQSKLVKEKEINVNSSRYRPTKSPERFAETPPRAQETYQNLQLVKPKAFIPINSERALPNPYHNDQGDPKQELPGNAQVKTIERNLNTNGKEYPTKTTTAYAQQQDSGRQLAANRYDLIEQKQALYNQSQMKSSENTFFPNSPSSPNFTARTSPKSPTLENSKLRLPPNREKVNLQPRIKSPIPQPKVSTDKIIATELLKVKSEPKRNDKMRSPNHQNIDYPENDLSERKQVNVTASRDNMAVKQFQNVNIMNQRQTAQEINSSSDAFEAARWQQKQRELAKSPSMMNAESSQVVTDATVHIDSPLTRNSRQYGSLPPTSRSRPVTRDVIPLRQRSITPVRRIPSTTSLQVSPQKHEIRQSVQIYCWKELQKLKEKQDQELKYQMQYTPYGYVEDPIVRRSRSTEPSQQRNTRRSASLPREVAPMQVERNITGRNYHREVIPENRAIIYGETDIYAQKNPNFIRGSPQRRSLTGGTLQKTSQPYEGYYSNSGVPSRPIFYRGSLDPAVSLQMQEQLNKKVSFSGSQNPENAQPWPTKNGYVQSPPQRRVEKGYSISDDDVFLPVKQNNAYAKQNHFESPAYGTQVDGNNLRAKESLYGSRQLSLPRQNAINEEALYVSRQNVIDMKQMQNISRNAQIQRQNEVNQNKQNRNLPVTNANRQLFYDPSYSARDYKILNESPYGTRPISSQSYGIAQNQQILNESPYSTRSNNLPQGSPSSQKENQQVMKEPIYGLRQNQVIFESPYGSQQNRNIVESPYGVRTQHRTVSSTNQQVLSESPYAIGYSTPIVESPYGSRDPRQNQVVSESPYGTRRALKESLYGSRQSVQSQHVNPLYSSRQNVAAPKQITVSDKVCDFYGQIHDTGNRKPLSPTSYSHAQQTGVIYGQLQPGNAVSDKPPQHQSYNQMPNNFPRGTRLTASANDMHKRYQIDPSYRTDEVVYRRQITEFNPDAPLPPIPNDGRTRFLMKRAGTKMHQPISDTESDTSEIRRIMNKNYTAGK